MYLKADINNIEASVNELSQVLKEIQNVEAELETVMRALSVSDDFSDEVSQIKAVQGDITDNLYKLTALKQLLKNFSGALIRTENSIEKDFEGEKPHYDGVPLKNNDFSEAEQRTSRLFYGDEKQ